MCHAQPQRNGTSTTSAAFFMAEEEKDMIQKEEKNIKHLHDIELRLMLLESKLDTLLTDEITEDALNAMRFLPGEVTSAIETSLARVYDVDADELAGLLFPED